MPKEPKAHDTRITREFLVRLSKSREKATDYLWEQVRTHLASKDDFDVCMVAFRQSAYDHGNHDAHYCDCGKVLSSYCSTCDDDA